MTRGSLTIVGTGIQIAYHLTQGSELSIRTAEKVLFLVSDPISELTIRKLNNTAESLSDCYEKGIHHRFFAYECMIEKILYFLRKGLNVCVVFYGHPGVFVYPSHEVLRIAKSEGFFVKMMPAISAEDCLFADLGIDPARNGCHSFEATDFLIHKRKFDPSSNLILWQIGVIGEMGFDKNNKYSRKGLKILINFLLNYYNHDHTTVVYEASISTLGNPYINCVTLGNLESTKITVMSTLYIPPKKSEPDPEMLIRLNLKSSDFHGNRSCWQS